MMIQDHTIRDRKTNFIRHVEGFPGVICPGYYEYRWANFGCIYWCMTCPHQANRSVIYRGKEIYKNLNDSNKELSMLCNCAIKLSTCGNPLCCPELFQVIPHVLKNTDYSVIVDVWAKYIDKENIKKLLNMPVEYKNRLRIGLQIDPLVSPSLKEIYDISMWLRSSAIKIYYIVGQIIYPEKEDIFNIVGEMADVAEAEKVILVPAMYPREAKDFVDMLLRNTLTEDVGYHYMYQPIDIRINGHLMAVNAVSSKYNGKIILCRETNMVQLQMPVDCRCYDEDANS